MKIYLEEKDMPKSCLECNNENCEHQYIECYYEERHPNCPLQSLAYYTRQVSKEVVQDIKEKVVCYTSSVMCENCGCIQPGNYIKHDGLMKILDQIQGETK